MCTHARVCLGACVRVCACVCLGTCAAWGLGRVCTSMCVRASRVAVRVHVCVHMRACARAGSPWHAVTRARDVRSWQRQRQERCRRDSHYDAVTVTVTAFDERSPIKPPERESESFSKASVRERTFLLPRLTYRLHLAN